MTERAEKKLETRQRILDGSARAFRKNGYAGIGVDGLAKEAGVTSGAFYAHFKSKADVFSESVLKGMEDLRQGVLYFQATHESRWWEEFVGFYLTTKRTCDLAEGCTLQALPLEIARADEALKSAFEECLKAVATDIASGPDAPGKPQTTETALVALSLLIGSVTLARAVADPNLSKQIAESALGNLVPARP